MGLWSSGKTRFSPPFPRRPSTRLPGESYRYSNIGFGILGYSLSRVSGIPFMELVDASLIRPLGMHSSGFVVTPAIAEQLATGYVRRRDGQHRRPSPRTGSMLVGATRSRTEGSIPLSVTWGVSWRGSPGPPPCRSWVRKVDGLSGPPRLPLVVPSIPSGSRSPRRRDVLPSLGMGDRWRATTRT